MVTLAKKACSEFVCLIIFVLLGGLMFRAVEKRDENAEKQGKEKMMKSLETTMKSKYNVSEQDFQDFAKTAYNAQIPSRSEEWTVKNSAFFAMTIVTTIGYGVLTPTTPLGQILVTIYALLGIPFALLTLSSFGGLISCGASRLICTLEKRLFQHAEPRDLDVKVSVFTCLLTLIMLLTGSGVAVYLEEWTYLEAFYFWFVTFTTIGFGDYVLDKEIPHEDGTMKTIGPVVSLFSFLLTLFGLAAVASVVNSLVDVAKKRSSGQRLCPWSRRIDDSQEQGEENRQQDQNAPIDPGKPINGSVEASKANVTTISMSSLLT